MTSRDASARLDPDFFRKILNLEENKGFQDDAVMGGLDRFLEQYASEFTAIAGDDGLSVPYRDLAPSQRRKWVHNWLVRLEDIESPSITSEEVPGDGESPTGLIPSDHEKEDSPPPSKGSPLKPTSITGGVSLDSPVDRLRGVNVKLFGQAAQAGCSHHQRPPLSPSQASQQLLQFLQHLRACGG